MCGIAGFAGPSDTPLLKAMISTLAHRGPDDEDYFIGDSVSLAYRRLAIIDVAHGDQPIFNEDNTKVVVYNGEIYNFRELRSQLEAKHQFRTNTDTEVIVHLYEEYGEDAIPMLNGMFAFALYDSQADKLILARDRFGIKPLYYFVEEGCLYFASEIKALLKCKRAEPNDRYIYQYLVYRVHDHDEHTFFEGIQRLMPGHFLVFENGRATIKRYWEPKRMAIDDVDDLNERFRSLFDSSVRSQLISEVPVGSCLSGGIDSSAIVSTISLLMKQGLAETEVIGDRQKTFSAVFPGEINDESDYVDAMLSVTTVDSTIIRPQQTGLWNELEKIIYYQDEPVVSTTVFAQWEVMKAASKKVKVLLDGQGADELLAGYIPYYFAYLRQLLKERAYFTFAREFVLSFDILLKSLVEQAKRRIGITKTVNPESVLAEDFVNASRVPRPYRVTNDDLNQRLLEDFLTLSLPALLRYEDRNSMAFSVESRVPFLDNDLVDFVLSLPASHKIRNGWSKAILRSAIGSRLPRKIRRRRWKVGFSTPEVDWLRREKDTVLQIFTSEEFRSRKYFDAHSVIDAYNDFAVGKHDDSLLFWRLINLEYWLRVFIDGDPSERVNLNAIAQ
jgi:asparagine synthase (glutamine-hydrolysing)